MRHILVFLLVTGFATTQTLAQEGFGFGMHIGLNYSTIRGTSEVIAGSTKTLETFNYNSGLQGGLLVRFGITDLIGFRLEANYAQRGMKYAYEGIGIQPFRNDKAAAILTTGTLKYNLNLTNSYIELPLTVYARLGEHWEVHAGSYFAYLAKSAADGALTLTGAKTLLGTTVPDYSGTIDYNYLSADDDKADVSNNKVLFTEGTYTVKSPASLGAYYGRGTANGYWWNRVDYGLVAGLSYRMRSGLMAVARFNYGLADVTNNAVHAMQSGLSADKKFVLRNTDDKNMGVQISFIFGN
jgi:Outer membrane protein beta-barrel domain